MQLGTDLSRELDELTQHLKMGMEILGTSSRLVSKWNNDRLSNKVLGSSLVL